MGSAKEFLCVFIKWIQGLCCCSCCCINHEEVADVDHEDEADCIFHVFIKWIQGLCCCSCCCQCYCKEQFDMPPSLMNIGANCYLNSALQGISSCDIFLKELTQLHKKYNNLEKLSLFHNLIDILNGGKSNRLEISHNPIFKKWNKTGQQDSFELLAYVMNQVYNDIRKDLENNGKIPKRNMQEWLKVNLPMRIIIEYEIRCSCNNIAEVPLQSDLALHVSIPSQKILDLQMLVDRFFQEEEIEDYKCEGENCDGKNAKRFTRLVRPLPKTLCIHLQRTFWNGVKLKKINADIKFSNQLKIKSEFSVLFKTKQINLSSQNEIENPENKIKQFDGHEKPCNLKDNEKLEFVDVKDNQILVEDDIYKLTSIIVHYGSVDGGHYVCYKKMNDKWFLTDDSSIREVTENNVLNSKAYILFYEKS